MKIKNIVPLAGSLIVGAALAGAEPARAALPRVWTSLSGVKDAGGDDVAGLRARGEVEQHVPGRAAGLL